jgi:hypothetical protein
MEDLEMKLSEIKDYETKLSTKLLKSPFFHVLLGIGMWIFFVAGLPPESSKFFTFLCGLVAIWQISWSHYLAFSRTSAGNLAATIKKAIDEGKLANGAKPDLSGCRIIIVDANRQKLEEL